MCSIWTADGRKAERVEEASFPGNLAGQGHYVGLKRLCSTASAYTYRQLSVSILKTASMSGISNVSDMTYSWSLFTIFSMYVRFPTTVSPKVIRHSDTPMHEKRSIHISNTRLQD